jgi:hypothetical protein
MVAVLVVSGVGSLVDWNKEKTFVAKRNATEEEKKVSNCSRAYLNNWHNLGVPAPTGIKARFYFFNSTGGYGFDSNLNKASQYILTRLNKFKLTDHF